MAVSAAWYTVNPSLDQVGLLADGADAYTVNWGDGKVERLSPFEVNGTTAGALHSYAANGTYRIAVNDRPNDASTAPVTLRAYVYTDDTQGMDLRGTSLADVFLGGSGPDRFVAGLGDDVVWTGGGDDQAFGGGGQDDLFGGFGHDTLRGGDGGDTVAGGSGSDLLFGDAGYDLLLGHWGNDRLDAGSEGAVLDGQEDADLLIGGSGADTFRVWLATDSAVDQGDRVRNFVQGQDVLDFANIFSNGFDFVGADEFSGAGNEVRAFFNRGQTVVYGDVDGDKAPDFQLTLEGLYTLTDADFGLVV
jgi:Ca2+-binding RTX toxin-like protein